MTSSDYVILKRYCIAIGDFQVSNLTDITKRDIRFIKRTHALEGSRESSLHIISLYISVHKDS